MNTCENNVNHKGSYKKGQELSRPKYSNKDQEKWTALKKERERAQLWSMKFRKVYQKIRIFWNSKWFYSSETYQRPTCDFYDEIPGINQKANLYPIKSNGLLI